MSLPQGRYFRCEEMESPDFVVEFGPDVTGRMQLIDRRTKQYLTRFVSIPDFPPMLNPFLITLERLCREMMEAR